MSNSLLPMVCSMPSFPLLHYPPFQFSLVAQTCLTLCNPMDCSTPGFPVHHQLSALAQTHVHCIVMPSNHLILCHSLLLLPSIFASIRVFSRESVLHTRWPKYWSFSFSISLSNEHARRAQTNLVCTRSQEKAAVIPQETDPDLPMSVQESPVEAWVSSGLLQGRGY